MDRRWDRIQALYEAEKDRPEPEAGEPRPVTRTAVLGVDLAAHADHPAVAIVTGGAQQGWTLDVADRLPRAADGGDPLTHWARTARVVGKLAAGLLAGHDQVFVLVDGGGVGDAVAEQIRGELPLDALAAGRLTFHTVVTVAGPKPYGLIPGSRSRYSVGKEVLMDNVALALEQKLLATGAAVSGQLGRELLSVTRKAGGRLEAAGSGHDDLVAALALALLVPVDRHRTARPVTHSPARYGGAKLGAALHRGGVYVRRA
jgi:hypothetical protein